MYAVSDFFLSFLGRFLCTVPSLTSKAISSAEINDLQSSEKIKHVKQDGRLEKAKDSSFKAGHHFLRLN